MYRMEIRVRGRTNPSWSEWFGELQVLEANGEVTVFSGDLPDMAAVFGILSRLGSLAIPLISICCVQEPETGAVRSGGNGMPQATG